MISVTKKSISFDTKTIVKSANKLIYDLDTVFKHEEC